ncbi:MAG: BrnT family toxin, partial [Alphaproteobacteria bacterium]|nr:BrnT family toxin [Alphaproteobacteria bacterium]
MIIEDRRFDYGETRYRAIGLLDGRLIVLVFTPRGEKLRVISLRLA